MYMNPNNFKPKKNNGNETLAFLAVTIYSLYNLELILISDRVYCGFLSIVTIILILVLFVVYNDTKKIKSFSEVLEKLAGFFKILLKGFK